ncbi:hypothetical protein QGN23_13575 [Chryseobacterium gotjawalense]|uniref:Glycosyltransferase RgtA/B/C/D-like domain-containing protein n=1 Tax=Chryseobacterium gotjawalense TaxID=3042315 RepID=A0ABY8RBU2_9FLAO|nr:hypothetical protein [Chryseobacterium sp. wdc7]WHF51437.1 hypothetical protein QGN23_13575 [Chryseobacterium sp. wdc7]
MTRNNNIPYVLLNIVIFISIIITPFFRVDGGVSDDTYNYVKIAYYLPDLISSVFPLGYPLFIKLTNIFSNDYYISTRIIACLSYLFIVLFSYAKKFYFKETSLLMGMKIFTVFMFSYSETLFLPFFYVLIYLLYQFFRSDYKKKSLIFTISSLLIILCIIRYSSIFIIGGFIFMLGFELIKKQKDFRLIKSLTTIILLTGIGISLFLFFNYYFTGGFMGENNRNSSNFSKTGIGGFILKNIFFSFLNAMNPILNVIRINFLTFIISVLISLTSFIAVTFFIFKLILKKQLEPFRIILIYISFSIFLGLVYSSFSTGIDGLHIRLALPVYFCSYFVLLISYSGKRFLFPIVLLSLMVNFSVTYFESFDYLEKRENVKKYVMKSKKRTYYFNDIGRIPTESGGANTSNFFTLFSLNPEVKVLTKDQYMSMEFDSILLESELVNIKPINRTEMINNKTFTK